MNMEEKLTVLSFTCGSQMQSEAANHMRQGILSFFLSFLIFPLAEVYAAVWFITER
jgi:hypothetical protein